MGKVDYNNVEKVLTWTGDSGESVLINGVYGFPDLSVEKGHCSFIVREDYHCSEFYVLNMNAGEVICKIKSPEYEDYQHYEWIDDIFIAVCCGNPFRETRIFILNVVNGKKMTWYTYDMDKEAKTIDRNFSEHPVILDLLEKQKDKWEKVKLLEQTPGRFHEATSLEMGLRDEVSRCN